jgi:SAM-dependent methyltransferase
MPDITEPPDMGSYHKAEMNSAVWRSDKSLERFSLYSLRREEKYLFPKYFSAGSSVLDLACGAGRTTLCLYEMGYKVRHRSFGYADQRR